MTEWISRKVHLYLQGDYIGEAVLPDGAEWEDLLATSTVQTVELSGLQSELPPNFRPIPIFRPPENPDSPVGKITWLMV